MRTTLTIDTDVAVALERVRDSRDLTLKAVVNQALRHGLRVLEAEGATRLDERYRIQMSWKSGGARVSLDSVADALAWGEGEGWK